MIEIERKGEASYTLSKGRRKIDLDIDDIVSLMFRLVDDVVVVLDRDVDDRATCLTINCEGSELDCEHIDRLDDDHNRQLALRKLLS